MYVKLPRLVRSGLIAPRVTTTVPWAISAVWFVSLSGERRYRSRLTVRTVNRLNLPKGGTNPADKRNRNPYKRYVSRCAKNGIPVSQGPMVLGGFLDTTRHKRTWLSDVSSDQACLLMVARSSKKHGPSVSSVTLHNYYVSELPRPKGRSF